MAKQAAVETSKPGLIDRIREFFGEVKLEMSRVTWPSKEELKSSTQVVMFILAVLAFVVWVYDIIFQKFVILLLQIG